MKLALVHDYLTQDGGAEKVLEAFMEMYPESPIFVLFYDKDKVNSIYQSKNITTSFLQKYPFAKKKYQWYLPLMPAATEHLNLSDFDVVLSSTSAFAKGVITKPDTIHICYCHTPTRYLWTDTHEYIKDLNYNRLIKKIIPLSLNRLRMWDRLAADRVDKFIANSDTVQKRIEKYYNKKSEVINPPVELEKFEISSGISDYYLTGGRLVPYKRFDLTIQSFNKLGKKLKIFGEGPDLKRLKSISNNNIEFMGKISDAHRRDLYSKARAFIHPQEEDFGITAIESMASGRPVIAYAKGGALETVENKKSGILFKNQKIDDLIDAIKQANEISFNPNEIRIHAMNYSKDAFKSKIRNFVNKAWEERQ